MNQEDIQKSVNELWASAHEGSLGTLDPQGRPFVSSAGYIYESKQGRVILLLSDLAQHTKHLKVNPQVSFHVTEPRQDLPIHEKKRVTVTGKVYAVETSEREKLKAAYLKIFPRAEIFFSLPDFRFYEIVPEEIHWIGGFGKAKTYSV